MKIDLSKGKFNFSGKAMTVLGVVDPDLLGQTLMHEHLYLKTWIPIDEPERWIKAGLGKPPYDKQELDVWEEKLTKSNIKKLSNPKLSMRNKDSYTLDITDTLPELLDFKELGGHTVVDFPPIDKERSPNKLLTLSQQSGVFIIVGSSYYTSAWHPKDVDNLTVDELASPIIKDITIGMDNTNIRAGIIGETPADSLDIGRNQNNNAKILRAAARSSRITGATLSLHTTVFGHKDMQDIYKAFQIIEEEGVSLKRVIVGHVTAIDNDLVTFKKMVEPILNRGATIEFDLLGKEGFPIEPTLKALIFLLKEGYSSQILLSHDMFNKFNLKGFGGGGLTYVHKHVIPRIMESGISKNDIKKMMIENPKRLLTFIEPKL